MPDNKNSKKDSLNIEQGYIFKAQDYLVGLSDTDMASQDRFIDVADDTASQEDYGTLSWVVGALSIGATALAWAVGRMYNIILKQNNIINVHNAQINELSSKLDEDSNNNDAILGLNDRVNALSARMDVVLGNPSNLAPYNLQRLLDEAADAEEIIYQSEQEDAKVANDGEFDITNLSLDQIAAYVRDGNLDIEDLSIGQRRGVQRILGEDGEFSAN